MKSTTHIALIRGINVGRAKRVPMAGLRALMQQLGYTGVSTLLNSGNIVFDKPPGDRSDARQRIEQGLVQQFGVVARVQVLGAAALDAIVRGNPLAASGLDPSRHLLAFVEQADALRCLEPLLAQDLAPDRLALGAQVAYLWLDAGVLESPLSRQVTRLLGDSTTMRNWATVCKLHAAACG